SRTSVRLSVASAVSLIEVNDLVFSVNFGFYLCSSSDAPMPGDDGRPKRNRFVNNRVHDNASSGIFLTGADENLCTGNAFSANFGPLWFVNARRNRLESNSIPAEILVGT